LRYMGAELYLTGKTISRKLLQHLVWPFISDAIYMLSVAV
jgi:hypothetical protein